MTRPGIILFAVYAVLAATWGTLHASSPLEYTREAVEGRLRRLGPRAAEGIWLLTDGNAARALIAIERSDGSALDAGSYRLVVIEAEDRTIIPGTVIGTANASADADVLNASIAREIADGVPRRFSDYTIRLTDNGNRLEMVKRASRLRVNLYAAIPYLFLRPSLSSRDGGATKSAPPGAIRIFPVPTKPVNPVYL